MLTAFLKSLFKLAGFDLHRTGVLVTPHRATLVGAVEHAKRAGLNVKSVLDVSAAFGGTASALAAIFPDADVLAIEPLSEFSDTLTYVCKRQPKIRHIACAAGLCDGTVTLNVHDDLDGSSTYDEAEGAGINGAPREVKLQTLDTISAEANVAGLYLIKIDVQGAELDVLEGAKSTLANAAYVVVETSLFQFFSGGPIFSDVISAMGRAGFRCYDIIGPHYRLLDGALSQVDLVFVPNNSILVSDSRYATPQQRQRQNTEMKAAKKQ